MPQLEFFLIAESISVDQKTNRLSLFNIIEELRGVKVPADFPLPPGILTQVVAASSWNLDPSEFGKSFTVQHTLKRPGQEVVDLGAVTFTAERRKQRILQVVIGCPISPGEILFEVLLDGEHKAGHLVTVVDGTNETAKMTRPTPSEN